MSGILHKKARGFSSRMNCECLTHCECMMPNSGHQHFQMMGHTMSYDIADKIYLPEPSRAGRSVAGAATGHCTANLVLGDDCGVRVQAESWLELCHLLQLDAKSSVVDLQEQVFFYYGHDRKKLNHKILDVVTVQEDGQRIAYTIKPEVRLVSGSFLAEMQIVAGWMKKLDFVDDFRLLTDRDIDPIDLNSALMFTAVRKADPDADAVARCVVGKLHGGRSISDLTADTGMKDRGYRAVVRLMRSGVLKPMVRKMITPKTIVIKSGECHELCVSGLAHAGFRYSYALKRSSNMI
ncbi:hypothetical protein, partial [Loktanella sp. SALINAS62]|uniref:hypothetical protein n=1 Tax=Loktanella sp. SALINAS62 TaxID=2706124 RepID=UPI001B8D4C1C